jgi:hypothetical protein
VYGQSSPIGKKLLQNAYKSTEAGNALTAYTAVLFPQPFAFFIKDSVFFTYRTITTIKSSSENMFKASNSFLKIVAHGFFSAYCCFASV